MSYHLFYGIDDHDEYANGMEGYHGIYESTEAAYKAIEYSDNKWAQLVIVKPDGTLDEWASLDKVVEYPDDDHCVTRIGWLAKGVNNVKIVFLEMDRRYQKRVPVEPPSTIEIHSPIEGYGLVKASGRIIMKATGAVPAFHRWVESDPF